MAGKKGRKRAGAKKKVPKEDINETSGSVEEKKAKLNDEPDELYSDKLEPCLETVDTCKTNAVDLEEEESKYVPPFSRKVKRTLKRTGIAVSPTSKPKRPWRGGKQFFKDIPLAERSAAVNDKQGNECQDSQKIEEEENKMKVDEEEEEVDVVGIKPQNTCSLRDENFIVLCKNQTNGKEVKVIKEEFVSSPALAIEIPTIVNYVLDNVIDSVCKMDHFNSNKSDAALDETTSGKGNESCDSAHKGSESVQILADNSLAGSYETATEMAKFEESCSQDGKEVSGCKIEVPCGPDDVKGDHESPRRSGYGQCTQSYIRGSEREDPETGHSEVTLPSVKSAVLLSDGMSNKAHSPSSSPLPSNIDTKLTHTKTNFSESKPESDHLSQMLIAEDTEKKSKTDVNVLMSEDMPGSAICLGDPPNELGKLNQQQSPDQMVPAYCEPVTVLSQRIPDCMKHDQNGRDMCPTSSECLETPVPEEDENKKQADEIKERTRHTSPETRLSREIEESQPSGAETALDIYAHQEVRGEQTTLTGVESSLQGSSPCKETGSRFADSEPCRSALPSHEQPPVCSSFGSEGEILEFDCLMDCTDSQLVGLDSSPDQPSCHKLDIRQANASKVSRHSEVTGDVCSKNVPTDNGMIKGLISELSSLNKFIMGTWKDLENQKKQRQARLKSGKGKKLKQ